jgi:RHS repeat-associated protein
MRKSSLFVLIVLFLSILCVAQQNPNLAGGPNPYGSYHGGDIDSVSMVNGALILHQPVASYPQRGSLSAGYFLIANSKNWTTAWAANNANGGYYWATVDSPGISLKSSFDIQIQRTRTVQVIAGKTVAFGGVPRIITPDGASHRLVEILSGSNTSQTIRTATYRSVDGSGFILTITQYSTPADDSGATATLVDRDGNVYTMPLSGTEGAVPPGPPNSGAQQLTDIFGVAGVTDVDGNYLQLDSRYTLNGEPVTSDTMGRQLMQADSSDTPDLTRCQSPTPVVSAVLRKLPVFGGGTALFQICYSNYTFQTAFNQPNIGEGTYPNQVPGTYPQSPAMVSSIVLPNNSAWGFSYDQYGDIANITLPTGGQISYTWQTIPLCPKSGEIIKVSRAVRTRTVSGPGIPTATWTYIFGAQQSDGTMHNVVTDPQNNDTVHVISPIGGGTCSFYETQAIHYQGSQSANDVLKTVTTAYASTAPQSLGYDDDSEYALNVYPQTVATTLPNGYVSQVMTTEDSGITVNVLGSTFPVSMGNVVNQKEYDYGQGTPGALIRQTSTSYAWQTDSNAAAYFAANILDARSSVQVQDASGNRCSETDYTYDEPQYLTATSFGTANQHGAAPNSVRGNTTTLTHWLGSLVPSTATCQLPSGASWSTFSTHTNWYDTGEIFQEIDALGNMTTYAYDPAYWGALRTQTTNALGQSVHGVYDFNTSLITSITDANSQVSSYQYDNMARIKQANYPDSGQTNFYYTDTPGSMNVQETDLQMAPSTWITKTIYFDGFGRKTQTALLDPEGTDVSAIAYDPLGRVSKTFNPTRNFSSSTPFSQTQYDALARPIQITQQDNGNILTAYNSNCTTVTDEAGLLRRSCNDGLGRTVEVDEPGSPFAGTQASGSLTINGTLLSQSGIGATGTNSATASVPIESVTSNGTDQSKVYNVGAQNVPQTVYDQGTISLSLTNSSGQVLCNTGNATYAQASTTTSMAGTLASLLASQCSGYLTSATPSGNAILVTAKPGTAGNSYSVSMSTNPYQATWMTQGPYGQPGFSGPSFYSPNPAVPLAGGTAANPGSTVTDSGTVTVTVGPCSGSAPYSSTVNNNAVLVAQALVSTSNPNNLNAACAGVASAQYVNGSTLNITYAQVGTVGDVNVTAASASNYPQYFPKGSFSGNGALQNGANPEGPSLDHNYYVTKYQYDPLGNLICVEQHGGVTSNGGCNLPANMAMLAGTDPWRTRFFHYDTLSRRVLAVSPESGSTSYQYDNNGNTITKTDARGITVYYSPQDSPIDKLNRVTKKEYSNNDPAVTFTYDTGANGIGRRAGMMDVAGSASWSYDPMGRISSEQRTTNGLTQSVGYKYYLDGELKTLTYPSQRTITYTPSYAGRVLSVSDTSNGINYVTGATYGPDGQPTGYMNGNSSGFSGITNAFGYNTRLQMNSISAASPTQTVFSLGFDLHFGAGDNGNVYQIINNKDVSRNQTFSYDPLNRLVSAQNAGTLCSQTVVNGPTKYWGATYTYDAWGNLLAKAPTKCSAETLSQTANSMNQIVGNGYDGAGNMTSAGGASYSYDGEGRLTTTAGTSYVYSGDGERVEKSTSPSAGTIYWYGSPGVLAETSLSGSPVHEYVFFNGSRIARQDGAQVYYYYTNHLESTSVITNAVGTIQDESDYYPWGGELQIASGLAQPNAYKFTGKEYDAESGNHYFGARYHASTLGRFISPDDVKYSRLTDPQTWNLYGYVRNGPTNKRDFNGHDWFNIKGKGWVWQNGSQYVDPTTGEVLSTRGYRYLIVFKKITKDGATTGTLILYDQQDPIVRSTAFSGGNTDDQGYKVPTPNGTYYIRLDHKGSFTGTFNNIGARIPHFDGIQTMHDGQGVDVQGNPWTNRPTLDWGSIRANLNNPDGSISELYLHGKGFDHQFTHGCTCERSEVVLHRLLKLNVPTVPVEVK